MDEQLDLREMAIRANQALAHIEALIEDRKNWRMRVPVQQDDSDVLLSETAQNTLKLLDHNAAAQSRINALEVALVTQKVVMRVAKEVLEAVIDEWPHEWKDTKEFYNECMEAFKALDAALGFEG